MRKPAPLPKLLLFSREERNGIFCLSLMSLCLLVLPSFAARWLAGEATDFRDFQIEILAFQKSLGERSPDFASLGGAGKSELFPFDPNRATADDFTRLGLPLGIANRICNYREKGGRFREPGDFQKIYGLAAADFERLRPFIAIGGRENDVAGFSKKGEKRPVENFKFDPNTASFEDFQRLGLSDRTAQSILNYRSKGGVFRKKEDFSRIYTLAPADFERLLPFIELPEKPPVGPPIADGSKPPSKLDGPPIYSKPKPVSTNIDINKATASDWKQLPGVGEFYSAKILKFRDALGGFFKIEQVAETRGLPDSTFQKIRPFLILGSPVYHKINLNTAKAEEFAPHPYFDRRLSEAIVAYRESHGPFKKLDDLRAVRAIRADWFDLILPYLTVE